MLEISEGQKSKKGMIRRFKDKFYPLDSKESIYVGVLDKQSGLDRISLNFSGPQEYLFETFSTEKYVWTGDK